MTRCPAVVVFMQHGTRCRRMQGRGPNGMCFQEEQRELRECERWDGWLHEFWITCSVAAPFEPVSNESDSKANPCPVITRSWPRALWLPFQRVHVFEARNT